MTTAEFIWAISAFTTRNKSNNCETSRIIVPSTLRRVREVRNDYQ